MNDIFKLKEIINNSKSIGLFTGAGISVPSGIPDFRSSSGLYSEKFKRNLSPEKIISHTFFEKYPEIFYDFYFNKMIYPNALPNEAHLYFSKLEKDGKVKGIVTQNIDSLHLMAGSKNVMELHGSVKRNYCTKCHKFIKDLPQDGVPYCECGDIYKPDVVLYEEMLDEDVITKSIDLISNVDTLIVVGTSLVVQPASSLIRYFSGTNLVLINKSSTPYDKYADIVINDDIINVVKLLKES